MSSDERPPVPLSQLPDFKVADGDLDLRGWVVVMTEGGRRAGRVEELHVDLDVMKVTHVEVAIDDDLREAAGGGRVVLPLASVRVAQTTRQVVWRALIDLVGAREEQERRWLEQLELQERANQITPTRQDSDTLTAERTEPRYRGGSDDPIPRARHAGDEQTDPPPPRPRGGDRGRGGMEA